MRSLLLILWLSFLLLFSGSCRTRKNVHHTRHYRVLENRMTMELEIIPARSPRGIVMLIPSPFDFFDRKKDNALTEVLHRQGYAVIIAPTHSENNLINKENWSDGLMDAFHQSLNDSLLPSPYQKLFIIGFEEGGNILPRLCRFLKPDLFIAVNSGPKSPLFEVLTALQDTAVDLKPYVEAYDAIDEAEIVEKPEAFFSEPYPSGKLGNRSGKYWLSFYEDPTYEALIRANQKGYYILSENYPLINKSSRELLESALPKEPSRKVELIAIPGTGNFEKNEEEMELLVKQVQMILSSPR